MGKGSWRKPLQGSGIGGDRLDQMGAGHLGGSDEDRKSPGAMRQPLERFACLQGQEVGAPCSLTSCVITQESARVDGDCKLHSRPESHHGHVSVLQTLVQVE